VRALDQLRALETSREMARGVLTKPPKGAFVSFGGSESRHSANIQTAGAVADPGVQTVPSHARWREDPAAAARRQRALTFLGARPNVARAVLTDVDAEPGKVILTIGLRGVGTGEVEIPTNCYDARGLIAVLDGHAGGALVDGDQVSTERLNERSST
jgi:hypothetical protein